MSKASVVHVLDDESLVPSDEELKVGAAATAAHLGILAAAAAIAEDLRPGGVAVVRVEPEGGVIVTVTQVGSEAVRVIRCEPRWDGTKLQPRVELRVVDLTGEDLTHVHRAIQLAADGTQLLEDDGGRGESEAAEEESEDDDEEGDGDNAE